MPSIVFISSFPLKLLSYSAMFNFLHEIMWLDKSLCQAFVEDHHVCPFYTALPFSVCNIPIQLLVCTFFLCSPPHNCKNSGKKKKKCCNRKYYLIDTSCPWEAIAEAKQIQDLLKRNSWKPSKCWCAAVKPFICTSNASSNTSVWLKNFPCSSLRCIILSLTPLSTRFFVWKWKMTRLPFPDNINNLWNPFLL